MRHIGRLLPLHFLLSPAYGVTMDFRIYNRISIYSTSVFYTETVILIFLRTINGSAKC